jgi:porin
LIVRRQRQRLAPFAIAMVLLSIFHQGYASGEILDDTFLDRWNQLRTGIRAAGIGLETVNTNDVLSTVSGGIRRGTDIDGDLDLLLTVDAEKLQGWKGGTFFLYGLGIYGNNPSQNVGDIQGVSNIGGRNDWKLFEAWYQQNLFRERFSILAGLYDVTSEFDVIRSSSELFVHGSFGTGPDLSLSGKNGLSTFPTTAVGVRVQGKFTENFTVRAAVMDGVPGDPNHPTGTHVNLREEDGVFAITEAAYYRFLVPEADEQSQERGRPSVIRRLTFRRLGRAAELTYDGKYAFGAWGYTTSLNDLSQVDSAGNPVKRNGTYGLYALAEQMVYHERGDPRQGLTLYTRVGMTDPQVNRFAYFLSSGFVYTGLIPGRNSDQTGFGIATSWSSSHFETGSRNAGQPVTGTTNALEWTHSVYLMPTVIFQPDFQYIINPGSNPSIRNAFVAGFRLEIHMNWFK